MSSNRSNRRHHAERKKLRTLEILRTRHPDNPEWINDRRVGKFTGSRWGCQCELCVNPRRLWKGKRRAELTAKEYHGHDEEVEDGN